MGFDKFNGFGRKPIGTKGFFIGAIDRSDAISTLGVLFLGDGEITCQDACDSNDDGAVDISDAIATLEVLFLGNGVIPLPGMTECGVDPTEDKLGCATFGQCR